MEKKQEAKKETLTQIGSIEAQSLDQASRQPLHEVYAVFWLMWLELRISYL
jgi:hypothetical protein